MKNTTHPFPLRPPVSLFNRIVKAIGRDSLNFWICAAAFHFLTLTDAERDMIIRDYAAMQKTGSK
jgi:hypothetical protein